MMKKVEIGGMQPVAAFLSVFIKNKITQVIFFAKRKERKKMNLKNNSDSNQQIAMMLLESHKIVAINFNDNFLPDDSCDSVKLAVYMDSGDYSGIYVANEDIINKLILDHRKDISYKSINDIKRELMKMAPKMCRCSDPDLIPVKNGIFNYKTKKLMAFSPDLVFTNKFPIDYKLNVINPVFINPDGTKWDIEHWMQGLSDDPAVVKLLWELVGAVIRPNVPWKKAVLCYSASSNSGKDTLCELLRQLCGAGNYTSISMEEISKNLRFHDLSTSIAVINDGCMMDFSMKETDALKVLLIGDIITVEKKYINAFKYRFHGSVVQCINELPRSKDISESFYRCQLLIPFDKCFTGKERTYIKDEYLKDKMVLEYVLHKVLHMSYYEFSNPAACQELLETSRKINNSIHSFWGEMESEFGWDMLPMEFLYDIFRAWYKNDCNQDANISVIEFKQFFKEKSKVDPAFMNGWKYSAQRSGKNKAGKVNSAMAAPEPLIAKFNLTKWMNPTYRGSDINRMCICPASCHREIYKGVLVRVSSSAPVLPVADEDETGEETA